MRINSESNKKVLGFIYVACLLVICFDIVLLNIDGSIGGMVKMTPVIILVLLFLVYRGQPLFYYDSDGEVLNFTATEPRLRWMGKWTVTHFEFPKRKLAAYRFYIHPFRKVLSVSIRSKDGTIRKQRIKISYLNSSEIKDLKRSLAKVLDQNKGRNG